MGRLPIDLILHMQSSKLALFPMAKMSKPAKYLQ